MRLPSGTGSISDGLGPRRVRGHGHVLGTTGIVWVESLLLAPHAARCAVPPYFDIALGALLLAGALVFLSRGKKAQQLPRYPVLVLIGCLGVPATALLLLASQVNDDKRFVAAALPAIALGLVAVLRILDEARITGIVVLLLAGQFALMTLHSFDVTASARLDRPGFYQAITVSKSAYAEQLDDIVLRTCTAESAQKYNTVGGSYAWLNANTLTMLVAEQFALSDRHCFWAGLDSFSTDNEPGTRWKELLRRNSPYFLTVDYGNQAIDYRQHS